MAEMARVQDATIFAVNKDEETALHVAARAGSAEGVRLLLAHGAVADARDGRGRTALHLAASRGLACVAALIAAGARVDAADAGGGTPLHAASLAGDVATTRALLDAGARNAPDARGDTALHVAATHGHLDCMRCLVLAGRDGGAAPRGAGAAAETPRTATAARAAGLPDAAPPPEPPRVDASQWTRYVHESGDPYWYNATTDESQWHPPGEDPPPDDYAYDAGAYARDGADAAAPAADVSALISDDSDDGGDGADEELPPWARDEPRAGDPRFDAAPRGGDPRFDAAPQGGDPRFDAPPQNGRAEEPRAAPQNGRAEAPRAADAREPRAAARSGDPRFASPDARAPAPAPWTPPSAAVFAAAEAHRWIDEPDAPPPAPEPRVDAAPARPPALDVRDVRPPALDVRDVRPPALDARDPRDPAPRDPAPRAPEPPAAASRDDDTFELSTDDEDEDLEPAPPEPPEPRSPESDAEPDAEPELSPGRDDELDFRGPPAATGAPPRGPAPPERDRGRPPLAAAPPAPPAADAASAAGSDVGGDSESEPDALAVQQRHLAIWDRFLMNAAKLSLEGGPAKRVDAKAEAVLAAAAGEGPEPRATLARLLHEGVSPGVCDEYGRQPLHHAAFGDALDAARILYDCGADVDAADGGGNRPLHVAAARGSGAVLDFLLGCAAVVDASNHDGDRPLHLAAWMGHGGCAARLLAGDALCRIQIFNPTSM